MPVRFAPVLAVMAALALGLWAGPSAARQGAIRIAYVPPKNPAHETIYRELRDKRVLERIRDRLAGWSVPHPVYIRVQGCDGEVDASYEPSDRTLTICYEYLAYIQELSRDIPPAGVSLGLTPANYVVGPFLEVVMHELAHAAFDLKKVPILGREEDAADQVAAYFLLRLGTEQARRVIGSIALMYAGEAADALPQLKDFANEHGLPAQRFYNLLCISYGKDPAAFKGLVDKGYLPKERAEQCAGEYKQIAYAVRKLVMPALRGIKPGKPRRLQG